MIGSTAHEPAKSGSDFVLALLLSTLLTALVACVSSDQQWGVRRLALPATGDDPLFYLRIAREVVQGHGITFTGFTPTNGFQPLWLGMLVPLAAVLPDRVSLMRADAILCGALLFLCMYAAARTVRLQGGRNAHAWAGMAMVALGIGAQSTWLSETALAALTSAGVMTRVLASRSRDGLRAQMLDGVLIALTVLARLDQAPLALACVVALGLARRSLGGALVPGAVAAALLAPYFGWNAIVFHHLRTISSDIHMTNVHLPDPWLLGRLGLTVTAMAVAIMILLFMNLRSDAARKGLVLGSGIVVHALLVSLLASGQVGHWYWGQAVAFIAIFGPLATIDPARTIDVGRVASAVVLVVTVVTPCTILVLRRRSPYHEMTLPVSAWADANVPPGARVLVADHPGLVAYWTSLDVVAADGLTGDWAYQSSLAREGAAATLRRLGVSHVLYTDDGIGAWFDESVRSWRRPYGEVTLWVAATVFGTTSPLVLREIDEVARLDIGAPELDIAVIWRLP